MNHYDASPTHAASDRLRLLTLPDVAVLTQLGRTTLYRAIRRGDLRVIRIGRTLRVRHDDLLTWLERHCSGPILPPGAAA